MKEKIACYIRVSTQEQVMHGLSLDAQRDKLKDYAQAHNLDIVDWYEDEGISGRKLIKKRPALQRMLHDAHDKRFERIIFIKLDRFFRSVAEYHECMKYINPVTWTATEEEYDLTTANGRMLVNMKLTIAELEADQTSERIKLVNEYKIKQGQAVCGSRSMTIAYKVERVNGAPKVIKNKENEQLVYDCIDYFLKHHSVRATQKAIAVDKYHTQYGWKAVKNMLVDTKLYGRCRDNADYCEPYIDKETFDKIQDILKNRSVKRSRVGNEYMFTGLIKCPVCGRRCATLISGKKNVSKLTGKVRKSTSVSYACSQYRVSKTCPSSMSICEWKVEKLLLAELDQRLTEHIETITKSIKKQKSIEKDDEELIADFEKQMKNLTNVYIKGRISEKEYDSQYSELEAQLSALKAAQSNKIEEDIIKYKDLINSNWKQLYSLLEKKQKRAFWRQYIDYFTIKPDKSGIDKIVFF